MPAYRLIATADEAQRGPSRLFALHARMHNEGNETFVLSPGNATLRFADGTAGNGLDRRRASALIERLKVAPTEDTAARNPHLAGVALDPAVQEQLRLQLIEGLLDEMSLGSGVVQGYIVVDTKQRLFSLAGAVLEVTLVRSADGARLRQLYRFSSAGDAATANPQ
jgi:hypothetical protein